MNNTTKFNKIIIKTTTLLLIVLLIISNTTSISAAGFSMGISSTSVEAGDTITLTARTDDPLGMIEITPKVSGGLQVISGLTGGKTADMNGESIIKIRVNSAGKITVTGFAIDTNGKEYPANNSYNITIKEPTSNNIERPIDKQEQEKQESIQEPSAQKSDEEIAAEKKAAEEAEEEREQAEEERKEAELEEKKKTPLFSEINVISASEKMMDESLTKIETAMDTFEYSYTLPKRIDAFKLDLKADEGATLTYDKDHVIEDGKDSVVVPVKAVSGDIRQEFTLTISKNTDKAAKLKVNDADVEVYDDELLDEAMKSFGFEKEIFEQGDDKIPYFIKGKMSLVLVQEGDDAVWYSLDKNNKLEESGVLYLTEENNALFILEADEEVASERLYQNPYEEKTLDMNVDLGSVDSELNFMNAYKSWEYDEEREVVYGFDETGERDFYVFGDGSIKAAVVAFDAVDKRYQMMSWGLGGVLFSLVGTGSLFAISKKKNGQNNYKENEEETIV